MIKGGIELTKPVFIETDAWCKALCIGKVERRKQYGA